MVRVGVSFGCEKVGLGLVRCIALKRDAVQNQPHITYRFSIVERLLSMRNPKDERTPGKKVSGTGRRYDDSFLGFINIPLSDDDREQLHAYALETTLDVMQFLSEVMETGYKFSLALDGEHSSYIATLTGKAPACENLGYALSGRGPDAYGAVLVLWFKHAVKAHGGQWAAEAAPENHQLPLWR